MVHLLFRRRRKRRRRSNRWRKARWVASGFALGAAFALAVYDGSPVPYQPVVSAGIAMWHGAKALRGLAPGRSAQAGTGPAGARTVGIARVVDGDTVELSTGLRRVRIRVRALHAPELSHPGGVKAQRAMERLAARGPFTCVSTGRLTHGRTVADCKTATGEDVASALIRAGVASHCERYGRADLSRLAQPRPIYANRPAYCRRG